MNIYIPKHLRRIGVVDQLYRMLEVYMRDYYEDPTGSFDDYWYSLKLDPVRRFIGIALDTTDETTLSYLSKLFYSIKGTAKVFKYMQEYLGIKFIGEVQYTTKALEFKIEDVKFTDEAAYRESLIGFLNALLYFESLGIDVKEAELIISDELEGRIGANVVCFKLFTVTDETDEN